MLTQFGRARGLRVESPPTVTSDDGKPISSTRIRRLVATGQVREVIPLLGRPHPVEGVVVHGEGRGRGMGIPTANLEVPADAAAAEPRRLRRARRARRAAAARPRSTSASPRPSPRARRARPMRLEAFLLDHDGSDLYGQTMRIEFLERLRDERRFESPEALVAQITDDIERTREAAARPVEGTPPPD